MSRRRDDADGANDDPTEKLELVNRVKQAQRESEQSKQDWWAFADTEGGGKRDPNRHSCEFLMRFFNARKNGEIQSIQAATTGAEESGNPDHAFQALVMKVKSVQRQSPDQKQRWWDYCDRHKDGVRDPSRHDLASLKLFFEEHAGADLSGTQQRATGSSSLAEKVKSMQRQNETWKTQWWLYCDTFGGGVRDPNRHEEEFLRQFIGVCEGAGGGSGKMASSGASHRSSPYEAHGGYGAYGHAPGGYGVAPVAWGQAPGGWDGGHSPHSLAMAAMMGPPGGPMGGPMGGPGPGAPGSGGWSPEAGAYAQQAMGAWSAWYSQNQARGAY